MLNTVVYFSQEDCLSEKSVIRTPLFLFHNGFEKASLCKPRLTHTETNKTFLIFGSRILLKLIQLVIMVSGLKLFFRSVEYLIYFVNKILFQAILMTRIQTQTAVENLAMVSREKDRQRKLNGQIKKMISGMSFNFKCYLIIQFQR